MNSFGIIQLVCLFFETRNGAKISVLNTKRHFLLCYAWRTNETNRICKIRVIHTYVYCYLRSYGKIIIYIKFEEFE